MINRLLQFIAWGTLAAVVFFTVSPIGLRPHDLLAVDIDRALAFAVLTSVFVLAYPRQAIWIGGVAVACAGLIELMQELTTTRHARLDDAMIKAVGAMAGVAVAMALNSLRERIGQRRRRRPIRSFSAARSGRRIPIEPKDMIKLDVKSSLIEAVYFSQEDGRLHVRFRNGEDRLFEGVPPQEALGLVSAPSPGSYYMENIRTKFRRAA